MYHGNNKTSNGYKEILNLLFLILLKILNIIVWTKDMKFHAINFILLNLDTIFQYLMTVI